MPIVDVLQDISIIMDKLFDFVANDEVLSKDFEEHLKQNDFLIENSSEFNTVLTEYIFQCKMVK